MNHRRLENMLQFSANLSILIQNFVWSETEVYFCYGLFAYCSCNYNVNPAIALSGPRGSVTSNNQHISHGLLLCFNRLFPQ